MAKRVLPDCICRDCGLLKPEYIDGKCCACYSRWYSRQTNSAELSLKEALHVIVEHFAQYDVTCEDLLWFVFESQKKNKRQEIGKGE